MNSLLPGIYGYFAFAGLMLGLRWVLRTLSPLIPLAVSALVAHGAVTVYGAAALPEFRYWHCASLFAFLVMGRLLAFGTVYKSVSLQLLTDFPYERRDRAPGPRGPC